MTTTRLLARAGLVAALLALAAPHPLRAQSLEGSKWSIDQEGVDAPVIWWLGSQGRVRTGDIGTILPGYHWVQKQDSLIVSVGDTLRYAGILMANRLVGVRTGPRRQEGWWSGARADAPAAAVAQTPTTNPGTEQMNRPVDQGQSQAATPPSTTPATNPAPRTLRRIEREGAPTSSAAPAQTQSSGDHEIRRLNRPGRAATNEPTPAVSGPPIDAAPLVGRWVSHNPNLRLALEIRADSTATFVGRNGVARQLRWTAAADGIVMTMDYTEEGDREVVVRRDGAGVRMQGRGMLLYILMDRAPAGESLEPAVRQP
ncbi:MAG TPA: hypothetical protein VF454_07090 [Gemmatimonadales bacterium]